MCQVPLGNEVCLLLQERPSLSADLILYMMEEETEAQRKDSSD